MVELMATRRTAVTWCISPTAAATHAVIAVGWSLRINSRRLAVVFVVEVVLAPLPDIASHVVSAAPTSVLVCAAWRREGVAVILLDLASFYVEPRWLFSRTTLVDFCGVMHHLRLCENLLIEVHADPEVFSGIFKIRISQPLICQCRLE